MTMARVVGWRQLEDDEGDSRWVFRGGGVVKLQRRQWRQSLGLLSLAAAASLNLDDDTGESCWAAAALLNREDADGDNRWVFRVWQQWRRYTSTMTTATVVGYFEFRGGGVVESRR